MPLVGEFHTHFWERTSTGNHPPDAPLRLGGYPVWQASVIAPSLFGMIGAWWDTVTEQLAWWLARWRQIKALNGKEKATLCVLLDTLTQDEARRVLHVTAQSLNDPRYPHAKEAVKRTAQTIGFNNPQAWVKLSHSLRDHQGWAQNTWRHLNACHLAQQEVEAAGSTMSNSERHLLVQLAYVGFSRKFV